MPSGSSSRHGRHVPDRFTEGTPSANGGGNDWPAQAADTIERVVGSVRDKTTGPAVTVARGVVYGTFALVVGSVVAVLVAIAAVRAIDNYLPDSVVGEEHTWAAHLLVGIVFTILGMLLWSRRSAPPPTD